MELKHYLETNDCFMMTSLYVGTCAVYFIADETLDAWLDASYPFIANYLELAKGVRFATYKVLRDSFLGDEFVKMFDVNRPGNSNYAITKDNTGVQKINLGD